MKKLVVVLGAIGALALVACDAELGAAPGSVEVTPGEGVTLNGGGLNDGQPPPEVYLCDEDGLCRHVTPTR